MVHFGGSGTDESPCPRWSKRIKLYPFEIRVGVTADQREVFVRREFENISHGRVEVAGTVRVMACSVREVVWGNPNSETGTGIGIVCCE